MVFATIAAPLATAGINALQAPNATDAKRFAQADGWYQRAITGDTYALCKLQYMGGRRGTGQCAGEASAGFATQAAKDYTEKLYQQALSVLAGNLSPSTPTPTPPASTSTFSGAAVSIGQAAAQTAQTSSAIASALGQVPGTTPQQKLSDALGYLKWGALALGAGVLVYMVMRSRR